MNEKTNKKIVSFFNKYKLLEFKKGQVVFEANKNFPGIAFVKSGYSRMYTVSKEGKEITLPMFQPIFFCSLISAFIQKGNKYFFEAISPMEIWIAPKEDFMKFLEEDSKLYSQITKEMMGEFMDLTENIQQLVCGDAYSKIANLVHSMASKFGEKQKSGVMVSFKTPHRMLASMTGLTRETVTLQLLKLQKEGYLFSKGRYLVVKNMDKLKELSKI